MKKIILLLLISFSGFSQELDTITIRVLQGAKIKETPYILAKYIYEIKDNNHKITAINSDLNLENNDFYKILYDNKFCYINELWIIPDSTFLEYKKRVILKKQYLRNLHVKIDSLEIVISKEKELNNQNILDQKYIKKFGVKTYNKLKQGYYWIGMTKDMAIISLGEPKDINKTVTKTRISEQWVYDNIYLYFENGILETYQN